MAVSPAESDTAGGDTTESSDIATESMLLYTVRCHCWLFKPVFFLPLEKCWEKLKLCVSSHSCSLFANTPHANWSSDKMFAKFSRFKTFNEFKRFRNLTGSKFNEFNFLKMPLDGLTKFHSLKVQNEIFLEHLVFMFKISNSLAYPSRALSPSASLLPSRTIENQRAQNLRIVRLRKAEGSEYENERVGPSK